jgi:hypothetical protein
MHWYCVISLDEIGKHIVEFQDAPLIALLDLVFPQSLVFCCLGLVACAVAKVLTPWDLCLICKYSRAMKWVLTIMVKLCCKQVTINLGKGENHINV